MTFDIMEISSILVLFFCKSCNRSFRGVNKFLVHKQKTHNSEFQNAKCIVFEERITDPGEPLDDVDIADKLSHTEFQQLQEQQHEPEPHSLRRQGYKISENYKNTSLVPASASSASRIVSETDTIVFEIIKKEPELYFSEETNEKYHELRISTLPVATSTRSSSLTTNVTDANCDPLEHLQCDLVEFSTETKDTSRSPTPIPISIPNDEQIFETDFKTETERCTDATAETEWILGDEPLNSEESAMEGDDACAMLSTTHAHDGRDSRPFTCPRQGCFKTFSSKIGFKGHLIEFHSAERPYPCPHCGKAFSRKRNMERHIRTIHLLDIPFKCGFEGCYASFKVKERLVQHSKIHDPFRLIGPETDSSPKPFKCTFLLCRFACLTPFQLSSHVTTTHSNKVTRSSPGPPLPISFKLPKSQHDHLNVKKVKTGNTVKKDNSSKQSLFISAVPRPHKCPHCGQAFSRKRNMVRHINTIHIVGTPFKCTVQGCGAAFKAEFKLASHALLHDTYQ